VITIDLSDRTAVVTGGARGLGFGAATRLAEAGARLVLSDLDEAAAKGAADRLPGRGHTGVAADAGDRQAQQRVADTAMAETGHLDVWMNNAGFIDTMPVDGPPERWYRFLDVMLSGVFFGCQAAATVMADGGSIVNVASMGSFRAFAPGAHGYVAAKSGVVGVTRSMAVELAPRRIRVNAIAPGFFDTEGTRESAQARPDTADMIDMIPIPLGRQGTPDDIGKVVVFLASDLAGYVNGVLLPVDGGFLAQ
jgi:NAD(P)-dependent dehydrogenase (short-subunit alcohol dehydrogenase family)